MGKIFSPIKGRIIEFIDTQSITKEFFYKKTGISASNFKGEGAKSELGSDKIVKIITEFPMLNPEWLLIGKGSILRTETYNVNNGNETYSLQSIPLISGSDIANFINGTAFISERKYFIVPVFQGADFLLTIQENSMSPKYNNGDIIVCKSLQHDTFFQWNKVYVFDTEQGPLIKYINQSSEPECIRLVSENKQYPPFDIPLSHIRAIAIVLGVIKLE